MTDAFPAMPVSKRTETLLIVTALAAYIFLGVLGIHYGLPHDGRPLPYNVDEANWLEALSKLDPAHGRLNPHPEFHHPTFFLWTYGAALAAATAVGYLPRHASQNLLRDRMDLLGRYYLVGRVLQIFFGAGLLISVWWVGRTLFSPWIGLMSAGLLALCPGMVAAAHFTQASVPVAFWSFLSLSVLMIDQARGGKNSALVGWAGFLGGLAISTKYSALVLIPCMIWHVWHSPDRRRAGALMAGFLILGFILGSPFIVLAPESFLKGFEHHLNDNAISDNIPNVWKTTVYPLEHALPNFFGWPLFLGVMAAAAWNLLARDPRRRLLTLFFFTFYAASAKVGWIAAPIRMLVVGPAALLLFTLSLGDLLALPVKPWLVQMMAGLFLLSCVPYSMAIVKLRREEPFQQVVSRWIQTNIPTTRSIGVPRKEPYWWSPDIVYASFFHPERLSNPYKVWGFDFSKTELLQKHPDILVVSRREWARCESMHSPADCSDFFGTIDDPGNYHLIKSFPRRAGWGPWEWDRPEIKYQSDDDLWTTSLFIYERTR